MHSSKRKLLAACLFLPVLSCGDIGEGLNPGEIISTKLTFSTSNECTCTNAQLVTLETGAQNAVSITVGVTKSNSAGVSPTEFLKLVLGGAQGASVPLGCNVGNRTDPATTPTEAQKQCTLSSAFVVTDKKKYIPPKSLLATAKLRNTKSEAARIFDEEDGASLASCASSCAQGDFTQCLPLGSGYPQVYNSVVDLYNSAVLGGHDYIPNATALTSLGFSPSDVSKECERTPTRVSSGKIANQSLYHFDAAFQCKISSQLMAMASVKKSTSVPAFEILVPNYYEASIVSDVEVSLSNGATQAVLTDVLKSTNVNTSLAIQFSKPTYAASAGKVAPTFSGVIRTVTKFNDLLILETDEGCISIDP